MKNYLRQFGSLIVACVAIACVSGAAFAQGYGTVNGTVTDSTGAVVAGANVALTQVSTGIAVETVSGGAGTYVFPALAPSVYNLVATRPGFEAYKDIGIQVRADAAVTVNVTLRLGSTTETVTVGAETAQVNVTNGTLQEVIGTSEVDDLPLNGRNAAQLTEQVAGVTLAPPGAADQGNTKTFPMDIEISADGTFVGQTDYMLDGGNNVDEYTNVNEPFPMPDAVQEFSIQTNNYSARYGQSAGGVVNIITKSGTSQYHGDLFEYVRNGDLDASAPFTYNTETDSSVVDQLKRNQFGGTAGGPLQIPHLFHSNKSFGFFSYQKTTDHEAAATSSTLLPTIAQAGANSSGEAPGTNDLVFSRESKCISDPVMPSAILSCTPTGSTYTTTVSPAALSPVTKAFLTYVPALTQTGSTLFSQPDLYGQAEITARVDQKLTPKDQMFVRYFSDAYNLQGVENLQDILSLADGATNNYYNSLFSETHIFSDHIVNNFILSYQHEYDIRGPASSSVDLADMGVNIWQPAFKQINKVDVVNYFNISVNPQAAFVRNNYTLTDDIHFVKGRHNIDAGYHGEVSKMDINNDYEQPGQFYFNSNVTGDAMASFMFGYVYNLNQASGEYMSARGNFEGAYVQDSWRAIPKLTLDYGIRYEPFVMWHNLEGRMGGFSPALYASDTHSTLWPLAPAGMQFEGDPGFPPNGVKSAYDHFMPRLGFAYNVFGNGKTSVRGGAGTFYDSRMNSIFVDIYANAQPPFVVAENIYSSPATNSSPAVNMTFANPYSSSGVANPFPAPQPPPNTTPISTAVNWYTMDPRGFQDSLTYDWNLTVEQQLSNSLSMQVGYVATHATHAWASVELNPDINGRPIYDQPGCSTTNSCYTQYLTEANSGDNANYNSLQLSVEQRTRYGLTLLFNYVWSRALNDQPYNEETASALEASSFVYPITVANFKSLDYGPADFNHPNVIGLSYVYAIPKFLNDAPSIVRHILNDWGTNGIFQYRSGDPLTIISSQSNNSGSGQNRDRAVWNGGSPYSGTACATTVNCRSWLNPASFSVNPVGTYGNVVKGSFVGPHYMDWDGSVTRKFPITEARFVQFEADYFNLANHTNLGDPNTTLGTTFGRITSTSPQNWTSTAPQNSPRIAQLSLKLVF